MTLAHVFGRAPLACARKNAALTAQSCGGPAFRPRANGETIPTLVGRGEHEGFGICHAAVRAMQDHPAQGRGSGDLLEPEAQAAARMTRRRERSLAGWRRCTVRTVGASIGHVASRELNNGAYCWR